MNDFDNSFNISRLIIRRLSGRISPTESIKLRRWLKESEANRKLFTDIRKELASQENAVEVNVEKDWESFLQKRKGKRLRSPFWRYAAVAILLLAIGGGIIQMLNQPETFTEISHSPEVSPGLNKARLILANGQEIDLSYTDSLRQIDEDGGVRILNQAGEISYEKENVIPGSAIAYNTLDIPRGGEYSLILSDGTKVWLNAESVLKYPVAFSGEQRMVELSGEAYFQVTADENHPFIVRTKMADVKVYGTSFNVCAYPDDHCFHATLETGKISVSRDGETYVLEPGEQATAVDTERSVHVGRVNVNAYCSWRNGNFIFEEESLESILNRLSRWYDVNVFYQNEALKGLHFTGDLGRYEDFGKVLSFLEMTMKVKFTVKGHTITVVEK